MTRGPWGQEGLETRSSVVNSVALIMPLWAMAFAFRWSLSPSPATNRDDQRGQGRPKGARTTKGGILLFRRLAGAAACTTNG